MTKFDLLQSFNLQIVACLEIKKQTRPLDNIDGVAFKVVETIAESAFFDQENEFLMYGFVRDIDYVQGLQLIFPKDL